MGSISTTLLAINKKYNSFLRQIIYLDPADYLLSQNSEKKGKTWAGFDKFDSEAKTISSEMQKITSDVKVHVVSFTIRNYGPDGYPPPKERSKDNPKLFSRLNNEMVRAFYNKTPVNNRGKFEENEKLPHPFARDGNITKNEERVARLITKLLQ